MSVNIGQLNYYTKVLEVQATYSEHKREGLTNRFIFKTYIHKQFYINETTFYRYLNINAKRKISQIEEEKRRLESLQNAENNG